MQKRKRWISLGISALLALGTSLMSVSAAQDFTDGSELSAFQAELQTEEPREQLTEEPTEKLTDEDVQAAGSEAQEGFTDGAVTEGSGQVTEGITVDAGSLPDNDALFGGYASQFFYEEEQSSAPATSIAESVLNGVQQAVYEEMKTKVTSIASKGGQTTFEIKADLGLKWKTSTPAWNLEREATQKFRTLDTDKIITCLLADCPYELYWYEKTAQTIWSYSYSISGSGSNQTAQIDSLVVSMPVCNAYAYSTYQVNPKMVQTAKAAAANAKDIVAQFKNKPEVQKLVAYKEIICYLTDYNEEAVSGFYTEEYGDPWQLIWVFDEDESTKVVCEGYSKAFQYLCDLSEITCYTVTGTMNGGTGAGSHMWNIVEQEGRYYLADVTNSDDGTVGESGSLFLNTPFSGSVSKGYTYQATEYDMVRFCYDSRTKNTYGISSKSVLKMTDQNYDIESTTVKPAKTSITEISSKSAKKLTLTWKKVKNAKGYEIYRRAGTKGEYKKAATIKSGSTVKYTNSKLRTGTKYYYRIRAYSYDILGNKVYGGWSKVKSKTAR